MKDFDDLDLLSERNYQNTKKKLLMLEICLLIIGIPLIILASH